MYRIRLKLISAVGYTLAQNVEGKFLVEFQMTTDYFKKQIEWLEELKKEEKTIFKKDKDGQSYVDQASLEPLDILAIEKQQTELWKNILFLARQGEIIEIMRLMKDGRVPEISN